ncbi:hypothetical protein TrVE_jg12318 [Triparma verrucosa]|uniref:Orn/DAP/Arg decarboxylase 2 C-terminal domain-containing protein n=1 Tax=Triparma verrucosa TaxID=1606542 RepID=A0A9W7F4C3_9STRA|nr:hypothetical protein TrVE_jg12318 [Triparma verrucosa]
MNEKKHVRRNSALKEWKEKAEKAQQNKPTVKKVKFTNKPQNKPQNKSTKNDGTQSTQSQSQPNPVTPTPTYPTTTAERIRQFLLPFVPYLLSFLVLALSVATSSVISLVLLPPILLLKQKLSQKLSPRPRPPVKSSTPRLGSARPKAPPKSKPDPTTTTTSLSKKLSSFRLNSLMSKTLLPLSPQSYIIPPTSSQSLQSSITSIISSRPSGFVLTDLRSVLKKVSKNKTFKLNVNPTIPILKILARSGVRVRVESKFEIEYLGNVEGEVDWVEDYGWPKPDSFYRRVWAGGGRRFGVSGRGEVERLRRVFGRVGGGEGEWVRCFKEGEVVEVDGEIEGVVGYSFNYGIGEEEVVRINAMITEDIDVVDFTVPQKAEVLEKLNFRNVQVDDSANLSSSGVYVVSKVIGIRDGENGSRNVYIDEGRYGSLVGDIIKVKVIKEEDVGKEENAIGKGGGANVGGPKEETKIWGPTCDVIDKVWEGKLERVDVGDWLWFWVRGVGGGTGFNGFNIEGHEGEVVVRGWERNWRKEEEMK